MAGAGPLDGRERIRATHVGEEREVIRADAVELGLRDQVELGHGRDVTATLRGSAPR